MVPCSLPCRGRDYVLDSCQMAARVSSRKRRPLWRARVASRELLLAACWCAEGRPSEVAWDDPPWNRPPLDKDYTPLPPATRLPRPPPKPLASAASVAVLAAFCSDAIADCHASGAGKGCSLHLAVVIRHGGVPVRLRTNMSPWTSPITKQPREMGGLARLLSHRLDDVAGNGRQKGLQRPAVAAPQHHALGQDGRHDGRRHPCSASKGTAADPRHVSRGLVASS